MGTIYNFQNYRNHKEALIIYDEVFNVLCLEWNKEKERVKFKSKRKAIRYALKYIK